MRYLVEDAELEKLIETVAQEIKDTVDQFRRALQKVCL